MDCIYIALLFTFSHTHSLHRATIQACLTIESSFRVQWLCPRTPERARDWTPNLLCPLTPQSGEVMIYLELVRMLLKSAGVSGGEKANKMLSWPDQHIPPGVKLWEIFQQRFEMLNTSVCVCKRGAFRVTRWWKRLSDFSFDVFQDKHCPQLYILVFTQKHESSPGCEGEHSCITKMLLCVQVEPHFKVNSFLLKQIWHGMPH